MKPLSIDLRSRIVRAYETGDSTKQQVAARFAVSLAVVKKLISQWNKLGTIEPQYHTVGRKPAFNKEQLQELDKLVERHCDMTLAEIQQYFKGRVNCSHQAVANALERLGWGYKKNHYMRQNKTEKMSD